MDIGFLKINIRYIEQLLRSVGISFCLFFYLLSPPAISEPLRIAVNETVVESQPNVAKKIQQALLSTGLDIKFIVLPGERAIKLLKRGDIDMDVYRQASAVDGISDIIKVNPPINTLNFIKFTHKDNQAWCHLSDEALRERTVSGVFGARLFDQLIYPRFKSHHTVVSFNQVVSMVSLKRIDFGVWTKPAIELAVKKVGAAHIHMCLDAPFLILTFNSYISSSKSEHIPLIEKAYQQFFTDLTN